MSIDEVEARVQALELELQKATERSRLAKKAVKDAKALAKEAKRDKRRARKALIAAQEEQEAALNANSAPASEAADAVPKHAKRATAKRVRIVDGQAPPERKTVSTKKKMAKAAPAATEQGDAVVAAQPEDSFSQA
jgi:hypothetical protein